MLHCKYAPLSMHDVSIKYSGKAPAQLEFITMHINKTAKFL
jgi:hypothetical protein